MGPFDPAWYARHPVDPEADLAEDYRSRGAWAARSPAPLFSPSWYRAAYPDVAVAGAEPLEHYRTHGWREGRDPSPLFSTRAWLDRYPELLEEGTDPLTHYLTHGMGKMGPHPRVKAFDPNALDVGVVVVFDGDIGATDLVLWSLECARGALSMTVYLVDAGTSARRGELDALAAKRRSAELGIERQHEEPGLSFGQLANAGIWRALSADQHTHIALLEQSVLVAPGTIDALIDLWVPLAVPVLNLALNEQAVPIEFDIYARGEPQTQVAVQAERRRALIPGGLCFADRVEPALALFQAGALETAGLLDEQTEAGLDALDPLIAGLRDAGLGQPVVARHLYAHRLERSAALPAPFAAIERDSGMPRGLLADAAGVLALQRSAAADRAALTGWSADADRLLKAHAGRVSDAERATERAAVRLAHRLARSEQGAGATRPGTAPWDEIAFGDPCTPPTLTDAPGWRAAYRALLREGLAGLAEREVAGFGQAEGLQPLLAGLAGLFQTDPPVLVLTMDTDPVTGNEKDGYVQRVIAIDRALAGRSRIYLKMVATRARRPALVCLEANLWRLEIAHGCALGETLLGAVLRLGAPVYSQSLVGIDPPVLRRLLPQRTGALIMDMHGAVPEEFVMYGDHYMAQKYRRYEGWAAKEADIVVSVTEAMGEHFATKLGIARERMIVCPIFSQGRDVDVAERSYAARPRAIYAGGTQRWQMIPEMARLVADTAEVVDWVLLTPDTKGMGRALERAGLSDQTLLSLRSASQTEVFATYPRCDFGLLLREDDVVNRVACPTKLIEYLRFGVVPVMHSPDVGDFNRLGMRWVAEEDFRAGRLPDPAERAEMAQANHAVYRKLTEASRAGLTRIAGAVAVSEPMVETAPRLRTSA
ncbi:MAG: hypothetical protein AAGC57_05400 [Pseudomonadota bacterium]